jgi:hypothetical protein
MFSVLALFQSGSIPNVVHNSLSVMVFPDSESGTNSPALKLYRRQQQQHWCGYLCVNLDKQGRTAIEQTHLTQTFRHKLPDCQPQEEAVRGAAGAAVAELAS